MQIIPFVYAAVFSMRKLEGVLTMIAAFIAWIVLVCIFIAVGYFAADYLESLDRDQF